MSTHQAEHQSIAGRVADAIRRFSVLIALFWLGLAVVTNVFVPQLETVAQEHNVSLSPQDAPSLQASKRIGKVFQEFDSDSAAMIVLEGDQPLGAEAHHYYDGLIQKLSQDTKHVQHVQDFWGDPLTAAGSQSSDGKAALVQVYLAGNQGESLSNQSPSTPSATSWTRRRRRPGSRPTSPAPRRWSPISSRWAARAP